MQTEIYVFTSWHITLLLFMDTPNTKEDNEKHNTRGNDDDNGDYSEDFEKLIRDCQRQIRRNKREILDAERLLNEAFSRLESMNDE